MDKKDVIRQPGFPDAVNPVKRITAKAWQCYRCKNKLVFDEPATVPHECPECHGSIWIGSN